LHYKTYDMSTIPRAYNEIDLHHLQVLDVLLREHSLTRAALALNVTQPALSKTLARLRRYFDDPLFVRVALRMEPTPKALELQAPIAGLLDQLRELRSEHVPFDPLTSNRTFNFCVVDAGVIKLLPRLVNRLAEEAPHVKLRVMHLEADHLESWLVSGKVDFAMGSFPALTKAIRRQPLWVEKYVSVVRKAHPRIGSDPSLADFIKEKHVLVSTIGTGHAHHLAERAIEAEVPDENIVCRVPMFIGAALLAKHTDAVATLPLTIATALSPDLGLRIVNPPIKLPKIEIFQYWHDRLHREPGTKWIRGVFTKLFKETV
jgi:DNA-binding transcriptional LysR family regulator